MRLKCILEKQSKRIKMIYQFLFVSTFSLFSRLSKRREGEKISFFLLFVPSITLSLLYFIGTYDFLWNRFKK